MAKKGVRRSSVLGDRLWDADGAVWTRVHLAPALDEAQVDGLLNAQVPVVVHGFDRPFRTLAPSDTAEWWRRARRHFQGPASGGALPDADGLTYTAALWTGDDRQLLGFVEHC